MRRLDSASARLFVAIIETGGISRAAAREHIVASAVSKRLRDLETMLGVTLVQRSSRGVKPTAAGEALAWHARLILQAIDRAHEELSEYAQGVRGHIRVRASSSSLAAGLPKVLSRFLQCHPGVKIDLEERRTPQIFSDILTRRADLGVGPDILRPAQLHAIAYAPYDLCVVVPQDHPLACRPSVGYATTLAYDQVEQRDGSVVAQLLEQTARQSGLTKRTRIRVNGFETICGMVGAGMGVGVAPAFMQAAQSRAHGLRFVPLSDAWAHTRMVIVLQPQDQEVLPPAARSLLAFLTPSHEDKATDTVFHEPS